MIARIAKPFIREQAGPNQAAVQKDPLFEEVGANGTWAKGTLVYAQTPGATGELQNTKLVKIGTAGAVCYGQAPGQGNGMNAALNVVPASPFQGKHYPFDLRDRILEVNAASSTATVSTIGTTNGVTWAGGGTNGIALMPGQKYAVWVPSTGPYAGIEFLDVSTLTTPLFEIVALSPENGVNDNNPRIFVKIIPTCIQA